MSKLSLKKNDKNNKKITGFFTFTTIDKNDENIKDATSRTILQSIENKISKEMNDILVSPTSKSNLQKSECNEIEATPDLAQKPKRKRRDDVSDEETSNLTSPVFKRSKSVSYASPIKDPVRQLDTESPLKKSSDQKAGSNDLWGEEEDDEDLMACFDDSFAMSPTKSCHAKEAKKDTEKRVDNLAAKFGRHKVLNVIQESNCLILDLLEDGTTMQDRVKKLTLK